MQSCEVEARGSNTLLITVYYCFPERSSDSVIQPAVTAIAAVHNVRWVKLFSAVRDDIDDERLYCESVALSSLTEIGTRSTSRPVSKRTSARTRKFAPRHAS